VPAPHSSELQLPRLRPAPDRDARGAAEQRLARALMREQPGVEAELWDHFAPLVRGILVRALGPDRNVEESMQAVLLRVLRRKRLARHAAGLRAAVVSLAFDHVRVRLRTRALRSAGQAKNALDIAGGAPRALRALYGALDDLSSGERLAFTLRFFEGLTPGEAAALAHVSTTALLRNLEEARHRLAFLVADSPPGDAAPFEALGRIVRAAASVEPDLAWAAAARARFTLLADSRRNVSVRWRTWALVGGLSLAAAGAAALMLRPGGKLRYELLPASAEVPRAHAAPLLGGGTAVRFPDGSELALESDGSGRLVETAAAGGRFVLEDGTLWTSVAEDEGARWTVEAGPFAIRAAAGSFRAHFAEAEGRLEIELVSGSATVEGPRFVQRLVAGQHLAATAAGIVSLGAPPPFRPATTGAPRGHANR
jgi:DNA-directed RNA polymerase specialized sigma24 family protein